MRPVGCPRAPTEATGAAGRLMKGSIEQPAWSSTFIFNVAQQQGLNMLFLPGHFQGLSTPGFLGLDLCLRGLTGISRELPQALGGSGMCSICVEVTGMPHWKEHS